MSSETYEVGSSEKRRSRAGAYIVLIEAGFPLPLAERIAGSSVDLHRAVELLGQGCSPETAAEILL